jgi:hypothetical protein
MTADHTATEEKFLQHVAKMCHQYELELDTTPITGEWLERHGVPLEHVGSNHYYWRLSGDPRKLEDGITGVVDSESAVRLRIGDALISKKATLGQLHTACRLMGVKMPELKEAGK